MSAAPPIRSPKVRLPRLALSVAEAASALGVSADYFSQHIAPELRMVRRGRKRLISIRELEAWLERNASRAIEGELAG